MIRISTSLIFIFSLTAALGVGAEENYPNSVYQASTRAPEMVHIKSLTKCEYSKFATDICEKYGLDGPKEISNEEDRAVLLNKLKDLRKEKFKELSDPKVREDAEAKKHVQDRLKSLTWEINFFPNLITNKVAKTGEKIINDPPPLNNSRIPYGALLDGPASNAKNIQK